MSAQHTNGRLYPLQGDPSVLHAEQGTRGRRVCCTESFGDKNENNANARRLAACWNACDGIPTETLERYYGDQGGIDAALEEASLRDHAKAVQERDDLKSLHDGRPQVVLFCHDSPWNLDFRLSPDEASSLAVSLVDAAEACDTLSRLKETA